MADGLDVVAIRVEHEGAVVVRMVVPPQAGRAIVLSACRERGAIEGVDRGAVLGNERDVNLALRPLAGGEPEIRLAIIAETDIARAAALLGRDLHGDPIAKRGKGLEVERLGARVV